ncbi:hypothetical protein THRCLA_07865 [Thraustotheca clavata]|uniref:Uncharacterized protein n=1 Tax=Thraustotheca clavata TaxID=74557 RepID=A0A1V9ZC02_9STRA|nr:hypothetical protein THRCLA_07865 [Thraustotheca clavata]
MTSRSELVGRPLVPFFTAQGDVNASLQIESTASHEIMDVDARVWNAEQGYFEYPAEPCTQPKPTLLLTPQRLETCIREERSKSRGKSEQEQQSPPRSASNSKKNRKKSAVIEPHTPQRHAPKKKNTTPTPPTKWAWSAFQSSPDPKSLPMPPFLGSQPVKTEKPLPPPPPAPTIQILKRPKSSEDEMTLQLRKMLNIEAS